MSESTMTVKTARAAIEAILAAIPDDELPEFDRAEVEDDGKVCVWWGGRGRTLGSAMSAEGRDPSVYRRNGSWSAIEEEMAYRADTRFLANGDTHEGIRLAQTVVKR